MFGKVLLIAVTIHLSSASAVEPTRRGVLFGFASAVVASQTACARTLLTAPAVVQAPLVRSKVFSHALAAWPHWAMSPDVGLENVPRWARLRVHQNPQFMRLSPQERYNEMVQSLLKDERRIELALLQLPAKLQKRTGLPMEKVEVLTRNFLNAHNISQIGEQFLWMTWHREFFIAATEEVERIEPDLAVNYRLTVEAFVEDLDPERLGDNIRIYLHDGVLERLRISARLLELTSDSKVRETVTNAIYQEWWPHIFPGYNRYPTLSDMTKNKVALQALERYLRDVLPQLDLTSDDWKPNTQPFPSDSQQVTSSLRMNAKQLIEILKEELLKAAQAEVRAAVTEMSTAPTPLPPAPAPPTPAKSAQLEYKPEIPIDLVQPEKVEVTEKVDAGPSRQN